MATKPVKFFTNSRGFNFFPDFPERLPGGSRVLVNDPIQYKGMDGTIAFWRYFDPISVDEQLRILRQSGVNNVRIFIDFYVWNHFKNDPPETNYFITTLRQLVRALENNTMYCVWVLYDGLSLLGIPTIGDEYNDVLHWHYYPDSSLGLNNAFGDTSGRNYISSVCRYVSGSQATIAYEVGNEMKFDLFSSANFVKSVSALSAFDRTPNRRIAIGMTQYLPWHNVVGAEGLTAEFSKLTDVYIESGANLITTHPYTDFDKARSLLVDLSLSGAYDINVPIFFTEGAKAIGSNSHADWYRWNLASGLGWNIFQAFAPNTDATVYVGGTVGIFHSDGTIRMEEAYHSLTSLAINYGYKPSWLKVLKIKTNFIDSDGDGEAEGYDPPTNHPLTITPKYSPRYQLGNFAGEIDEDVVSGFVVNYATCAIPLSAIRNNYASEFVVTGSFTIQPELLAEQDLQVGLLNPLGEVSYFTARFWGLSSTAVSAYFNQWGFTHVQALDLTVSTTRLLLGTFPSCFTPALSSYCWFGPRCSTGVVLPPGTGDCFDYSGYTTFYKAIRDKFCTYANQVGFFPCVV